ncbi:unnamed protein product [Cylicocyclus nassatus]|uniref:Uncharacterized protein n=1 Tax=Cylicocyclus nassatus TaxID=53992 RepID=A0AA36M7V3_CYLNA|nr:unnamed protein product [Cylicocyclus nassatus]
MFKEFMRFSELENEPMKESCVSEGGILLECDRPGMVDDVADILRSLYDNGLHESSWLVSRRGGEAPRAISRQAGGHYKIIDVPSSAAFPFLCSLTRTGRRSLLIQDMLLNTGAPRLTSHAAPEVFFHTRADADYVVLPCSAEGNPPPEITWLQNDIDVVIPSASGVSYLLSGGSLLVPAEPSLAYSSFHCTAKNKFGEVRGPSTILKPAFLESFRPHRGNVVPLYNGGAKLECEAPNHQPKHWWQKLILLRKNNLVLAREESYSFLWLYDSSTDRILPNSERTLVSLDGTLYFSYVTKDDETSYACSLSLTSTQSGHYGPFFRLQVPIPQEMPFAPRIDSSQPQVFPEAPTLGSAVYLECFAYGNPVPVYKWTRVDGRRINKKAIYTQYGRVLRIDHAEASDNGRYKCSAGNSLGVAAGEVTLTLRTPPSIIIPLSDRVVPSASSFTLECPLSTMDMQSSVEWFKDAKPIVPLLMPSQQRRRFTVEQNILIVNSTTEADSGVYQCVVSNEVGVVSSSAYVLIRDSPPVFPRQSMPKKLFAVNGSSVTVPCYYYASPRGHSRWADAGGVKLPHKGRVRDHHGVLHIQSVLPDDAGYFFCTAHNRQGKAHTQVELVVVDKAQVQVSSESSAPESAVNISCSVAVDCGTSSECPEAFFKWTFDNRSLDSLPKLHIKTKFREQMRHSSHGRRLVQKVDLQMSPPTNSAKPSKVVCFSLYGEDALELTPKPLIPAPLAVRAEQDEQAVRLAWRKPSTHRDIRNHAISGENEGSGGYLVELRTKEDRQWRPAPREVVGETDSQSVTLDGLSPNTLYQFRVRTIDSVSSGDLSAPTSWIRTPPAAPVEAVDGLRWKALDNNTIFVEWNPVETAHSSGDHLRYRLSWSLEDNNAKIENISEGERNFRTHHVETKTPQAIVRMNTTDECRMLIFSVRPVNDQGIGLTSTDTVAFVNNKGEPRKVHFTNVTALNSTHIFFTWEWDKVNECGRARAVQLNCSTDDGDSIAVAIAADLAEWILGGLSPDTKYTCTLQPFDSNDSYDETNSSVEVTTKQRPPSEAPTINKLSLRTVENEVGYTTIIEWTAIDFPHSNATDSTTGYKIFVYVSETASEAVVLTMPSSRLTNPDRPSARIDGLRLMYMYTIQVAGYNSGGVGPLSSPRIIRLGPQSTLDEPSSTCYCRLQKIIFIVMLLLLL